MNLGILLFPNSNGSLEGSEASTWKHMIRYAKTYNMHVSLLNASTFDRHIHSFDVIWDRARWQNSTQFTSFFKSRKRVFHQSTEERGPIWMNGPFINKWAFHRRFVHRAAALGICFPQTFHWEDLQNQTINLASRSTRWYVKPVNGTGGRGILLLEKHGRTILCTGSDEKRNKRKWLLDSDRHMHSMIKHWITSPFNAMYGQNYIIQQAVDTRLSDGRVHDFRLLVQKDRTGEWCVSGIGARIGGSGQNGSNLHAGGSCCSFDEFSQELWSQKKLQFIRGQLMKTALAIAKLCDGSPSYQCEFGCDLAVGPTGDIFVLELNPKPGRKLFTQISDREAFEFTHTRPIDYAMWLYHERQLHKETSKRK